MATSGEAARPDGRTGFHSAGQRPDQPHAWLTPEPHYARQSAMRLQVAVSAQNDDVQMRQILPITLLIINNISSSCYFFAYNQTHFGKECVTRRRECRGRYCVRCGCNGVAPSSRCDGTGGDRASSHSRPACYELKLLYSIPCKPSVALCIAGHRFRTSGEPGHI